MIFDLSKSTDFYNLLNFIKDLRGKLIEIKEYKPKRTNQQRKYYFAICSCVAEYTGHTTKFIHGRFKAHFLKEENELSQTNYDRFNEWAEAEPIEKSTNSLNTKEFSKLIDNVKLLIIDLFDGTLIIPEPSDKDFESFLKHYENYI